ncbi:MAG: hypothetical protein V4655_12890 [Bdellovibrionota bacterium]
MKLVHQAKTCTKVLFLMLALNACAGGEEAVEDPVQENGEENAANVEGEEGENVGNENFGNENLGENENGLNGENTGNNLNNENTAGAESDAPANEFVNNAAGDNFLNDGASNLAAEAPATDPTADAALAENSSEDLGIAPSDAIVAGNQNAAVAAPEGNLPPDTSMGATDTSIGVSASSAPVAPMTGGRVHYVLNSGTSAYDKPSGQVVKTYEKGDHPLVSADGEWVQTSDGVYLPNTSLTTKPVSRAKSPKAWR